MENECLKIEYKAKTFQLFHCQQEGNRNVCCWAQQNDLLVRMNVDDKAQQYPEMSKAINSLLNKHAIGNIL